MKAEGGCLCGALRYTINAGIIDAGFCHCSVCRRSSGAPVLAWLTIPFSGFRYTDGNAGKYDSSAGFTREFCISCGTQIAFRARENPGTIDVTLCSLDDDSCVAPQYHIWCQSKLDWLAIEDDLPRYCDAGPDGD
jgi:hypothetical protein